MHQGTTAAAAEREVDLAYVARRIDEILAAQDDINETLSQINASLRARWTPSPAVPTVDQ